MDWQGELNELTSNTSKSLDPSSEEVTTRSQDNLISKNVTSSTDIEASSASMESRNETPSPLIRPAATNQLHFSFVTHMVDVLVDPNRLLQDIRSCGASAHNLIVKKQGINEAHVSQSGYGFVSFESPQACRAAHDKLKGMVINGITYDCSMARRTFSLSRSQVVHEATQLHSFRPLLSRETTAVSYVVDNLSSKSVESYAHPMQWPEVYSAVDQSGDTLGHGYQAVQYLQYHQQPQLNAYQGLSCSSYHVASQHSDSYVSAPYDVPAGASVPSQHHHPAGPPQQMPVQHSPNYYIVAQLPPAQQHFSMYQPSDNRPQIIAPYFVHRAVPQQMLQSAQQFSGLFPSYLTNQQFMSIPSHSPSQHLYHHHQQHQHHYGQCDTLQLPHHPLHLQQQLTVPHYAMSAHAQQMPQRPRPQHSRDGSYNNQSRGRYPQHSIRECDGQSGSKLTDDHGK